MAKTLDKEKLLRQIKEWEETTGGLNSPIYDSAIQSTLRMVRHHIEHGDFDAK